MELTDNLNIREMKPLPSPEELKQHLPITDATSRIVAKGRKDIQDSLSGISQRPIVILGPCSIHHERATLEYARRLKALQDSVGDSILLVMRAYFEKPRTTLGWKGLLYDPALNETEDIHKGIHLSRKILLDITEIGLPIATEILDPIIPQFLCDLISWAAIGARTAESQIHRQMASGLSMPIGIKNATDGNLNVAVEAITAAASPHAFLGINHEGLASIALTRGNRYGHVVLRGGSHEPNYASEYVVFVEEILRKAGIKNGIIIDCSHANSNKDHTRQHIAFRDVIAQREAGRRCISGMMIESFLNPGNQPLTSNPADLQYGVSITDKCIGWAETEELIRYLADSVKRWK